MPCILGVDPGVTGGLAFFFAALRRVHVYDIPAAAGEVDAAAIVALLEEHCPDEAFVERAQSMPRQGVASTFKYGVAYGSILTALAIGKVPTHRVAPRKWKHAFGLDSDKEKSRALAIRLFPHCDGFTRKKDHGRAEAALIARYGAGVLGLLGQQVAA